MTLSELHVALLQAGIPVQVCNGAAEAMVHDDHVGSWTSNLISSQVAKIFWLCFVCDSLALVAVESELLKTGRTLPTENGQKDGDTVTSFLSMLVRNEKQAAGVLTLEVSAAARQMVAVFRDGDTITFTVPGTKAASKSQDTLTIGGMFISRAAMAYSSRVWLPFNQQAIEHVG